MSGESSVSKRVVKGATIAGVYLLMILLLEGGIRLFYPQPLDWFAFPKEPPKPGTTMRLWGIDVHFNSSGMRDREYRLDKNAGVTRIVVIGDSIPFGVGVRLEDTFHKKLEAILNQGSAGRYEVPAFTMGDTDLEWALDTYEKTVRRWHPDIVVHSLCLNDFVNYEETYAASGDPARATRPLKERLILAVRSFHQTARLHSHLYFLVLERSRRLLYRYVMDIRTTHAQSFAPLKPQSPEFTGVFSSTAGKIKAFRDRVAADGARYIELVFPYEMQLSADHIRAYENGYGLHGYDDAPQGAVQRMLGDRLRTEGIEFIDLLPVFRDAFEREPGNPLYFRNIGGMLDWVHPNPHGNELAARAIASYLGRKPRPQGAGLSKGRDTQGEGSAAIAGRVPRPSRGGA